MSGTAISAHELNQFTGSEHWYRHALVRGITFTDGVKYVADKAQAYWLVDEIAFSQKSKAIAKEAFQAWKLTVKDDKTATLVCEDGNGHVVHTKQLDYTDFPMPEISIWFSDNVIFLPNEY